MQARETIKWFGAQPAADTAEFRSLHFRNKAHILKAGVTWIRQAIGDVMVQRFNQAFRSGYRRGFIAPFTFAFGPTRPLKTRASDTVAGSWQKVGALLSDSIERERATIEQTTRAKKHALGH
ncbi:hypothetical protein ABIE69_001151 [Rhodobacteraceae bacterium MBR-64]|jgi:hypothetical protein